MSNKLIVAAAGSGKTTHLVNEALKIADEKVLITTKQHYHSDLVFVSYPEWCKTVSKRDLRWQCNGSIVG